MKLKNKIVGSEIQRRASPQTKLIDEKQRKIPFILISKDNKGERYCCGEVDYIEELDVNGAKFDNLRTFFKDHDRSVDSAIGKIENIRVEDGELKADVIFGSTADAEEVFNKYREGILTDVSVGYKVKEIEVIEKTNEAPLVRVVDFDLVEVSAVGVGFDKGATLGRNKFFKEDELDKEKIEKMQERLKELEGLKERNEEQTRELEDLKAQVEEFKKREAEFKELQRKAELQELAIAYGADKETLQRFLEDKTKTKEDFLRAMLEQKADKQPSVYAGKRSDETREEMLRAMSDGLMLRLGFNPSDKHKDADMFRGMSVQNMVRKIAGLSLEASESELVRAMTTSDFPKILANVQNKVIQDAFASAPVTFRKWTQAVDFKDFKPRTEVRKGSFGADFKKVQELGKTEYVEKGETGTTWQIHSYGARFAFSRQMLMI
jgi:HK97 family phage prohead protease